MKDKMLPGDPEKRNPSSLPLPYIRKGRFFMIFFGVLFFHAALLLIPFIFQKIRKILLPPPLKVEKVSLVGSFPENINSPLPKSAKAPSPRRKISLPDSGPDIPDLTPVLPDPPPPSPPPRHREPPQKTSPSRRTPPVIRKKSPVQLPPAEKKVARKPKKKYTDARDIKVSRKRVVRKPSAQVPAKIPATTEKPQPHPSENIRNLLKEYNSPTHSGREKQNPGEPGESSGKNNLTPNELSKYYASITAALKRLWVQPRLAALQGATPTVDIELSMDGEGRVTSARILRRSGVRAMDTSVENLLRVLRVLPKPPYPMPSLRVTIEIENQ